MASVNAKDLVKPGDAEKIIGIRREIHRHPEMKFELDNTVSIVKRELEKLDIPYTEKYGKGSVVGIINGDCKGPTFGFRADMDALPIVEETGLPFASEIPGVMHACGHDSHTAMLIGTATLLKRAEKELKCRVLLIFQPCEEGPESGADLMIKNGILDELDYVAGLHVENGLPVGTIAAQRREAMAACHSYEIEFFGSSSHATRPQNSCDALAMAVKAYNDIYLQAARKIGPMEQYVLSIGSLNAGSTHNIITDYAKMMMCVRYYDVNLDKRLEDAIKLICRNAAEELGGTAKVTDPMKGHPLINDVRLTERLHKSAVKVVGEENFRWIEPYMSSEDFSHFSCQRPGIFFRIGTRNPEKGCVGGNHNSDVIYDEDAFITASTVSAQFLLDFDGNFEE